MIDNMEVDKQIEDLMENMTIEDEPLYNIHQNIKVSDIYSISKINMNFYQIWSILRCVMPNVYENGKTGYTKGLKYYEYNLVSATGDIFTIYSYGESFITIKEWYIGSSTNDQDKNNQFLNHIASAIECYNNGYSGMEQLNFNSKDTKIHQILQEVKGNIIKHKKMLKTL